MIRTVIIDKLLLARRRLTTLLSKESDILIVYAGDDAADLDEIIRNERPELLFLDIDLSGTDQLKAIAATSTVERPQIVFVTAYEHFAAHAFTVGATDYLLKPVTPQRLQLCLNKVRRSLDSSQPLLSPTQTDADNHRQQPSFESPVQRRIAIRSGKKRFLLTLDSIEWCEAAGNYVIYHVGQEKHVARATIGDLPRILGATRFLRISKSIVVNIEHVSTLEQMGAGDLELTLANGTTHVVSRVFRDNLECSLAGFVGSVAA